MKRKQWSVTGNYLQMSKSGGLQSGLCQHLSPWTLPLSNVLLEASGALRRQRRPVSPSRCDDVPQGATEPSPYTCSFEFVLCIAGCSRESKAGLSPHSVQRSIWSRCLMSRIHHSFQVFPIWKIYLKFDNDHLWLLLFWYFTIIVIWWILPQKNI